MLGQGRIDCGNQPQLVTSGKERTVMSLREELDKAQRNKVAIGHFNISDLEGLKAVFESAREV